MDCDISFAEKQCFMYSARIQRSAGDAEYLRWLNEEVLPRMRNKLDGMFLFLDGHEASVSLSISFSVY